MIGGRPDRPGGRAAGFEYGELLYWEPPYWDPPSEVIPPYADEPCESCDGRRAGKDGGGSGSAVEREARSAGAVDQPQMFAISGLTWSCF